MSAYPYPAPPAPIAVPINSVESEVVREVSMPLYQSRGWLKFVGVLMIIGGIPGIAGLVGILTIWQGVLLFQAASSIEMAATTGQKYALSTAIGNLKTFFVLNGVLILVGLILALVMICVAVVLPLLGVSLIPFLDLNNYY